jgi:hypothetical protein
MPPHTDEVIGGMAQSAGRQVRKGSEAVISAVAGFTQGLGGYGPSKLQGDPVWQ